jgi:hypothetical protein
LLWRQWDAAKPVANFLMLNPSTADELKLDPSCTRARRYAEAWGYGALIVTNVFGFRNTNPNELRKTPDPIGTGNDAAIVRAAKESAIVVCAWGNHGEFQGRSKEVLRKLKAKNIRLHALRVNANGEPAHPLYLPGNLKPKTWVPPPRGRRTSRPSA